MLLSGHDGAIYSIDFDPEGSHLVSASYDRQICKLLCIDSFFALTLRVRVDLV